MNIARCSLCWSGAAFFFFFSQKRLRNSTPRATSRTGRPFQTNKFSLCLKQFSRRRATNAINYESAIKVPTSDLVPERHNPDHLTSAFMSGSTTTANQCHLTAHAHTQQHISIRESVERCFFKPPCSVGSCTFTLPYFKTDRHETTAPSLRQKK